MGLVSVFYHLVDLYGPHTRQGRPDAHEYGGRPNLFEFKYILGDTIIDLYALLVCRNNCGELLDEW